MQASSSTPVSSAFLAYPSLAVTSDRLRRVAAELPDRGIIATTWQDLNNPGFLCPPIADAIGQHELFVAEITHGNPNVLFEVGFAIARGKPILLLKDDNVADPQLIPPLEFVRLTDYTSRDDILEAIATADIVSPSLHSQLGLDYAEVKNGTLYFIQSRRAPDFNQAAWSICSEAPFRSRMMDIAETDYDNLKTQAVSIAEAEVFLTILVNKDTKDYWLHNAACMFFAGLAVGMGKDSLVLVQQPYRSLIDLADRAARFETQGQLEYQLKQWLRNLTGTRLVNPPVQTKLQTSKSSDLAGLFFGSLDARADFNLGSYFLETPEFAQAEAAKRHLFVGSKGSGKTANYEILRDRLLSRNVAVVSIAPADFEFPRLAAVFDEHLHDAHWEFVYGSFWRFVLYSEILRAIRDRFLDHLLRESGEGKFYARELLDWLEKNTEPLALDFVSRVDHLISEIEGATGDDHERRDYLEGVLQAARMYDIDRSLKEFTRQFEVRLLIDDLDRNWVPGNPSATRLILTLLNEALTLMTNQAGGVKPTIFLRHDVFRWLEANDPELLKRDPGFLKWSPEALENLVANRIRTQTGAKEEATDKLWSMIFPEYILGEGTPAFVVRRTLQRPRDVIQFCQHAVESAQRAGRDKVIERDLIEAWEFSGERLLIQAQTEYQSQYPRIGDIVLALFEGPLALPWSKLGPQLVERVLKNKSRAPWLEHADADPLIVLAALYEIGVLGVESPGGSRWFETTRAFPEVLAVLSGDFAVLIHPAFHRYLRCLGT